MVSYRDKYLAERKRIEEAAKKKTTKKNTPKVTPKTESKLE